MILMLLLPTEILVHEEVRKIVAEARNGSFCLLPRHIDFTTALVPGILMVEPQEGPARYFAVDEGILVKCGHDVRISVRDAVEGRELGALRATVEERFEMLDDRERMSRTALARLEAGFVRGFLDVNK